MRLLICTQAVDENDPALGFFVTWIKEFAKHFESIVVICLFEGVYTLPPNVVVYSLGKEKKSVSSFLYAFRFLALIVRLRAHYDRVFVHMNQEYVLLAGVLWRTWGKKIGMWRNHYAGSILTNAAIFLCDVVFSTSQYSYTAKSKKNILMPVGIDTDYFTADTSVFRKPGSILMLGRLDESKRIDILLRAASILKTEMPQVSVSIVGNPSQQDASYPKTLRTEAETLGLKTVVAFKSAVKHAETVKLYSAHEIFVNLSRSGMLDKTIFEGMACGACVVTCSGDLEKSPFTVTSPDAQSLADRVKEILLMTDEEKKIVCAEQRQYVSTRHSLSALALSLKQVMS